MKIFDYIEKNRNVFRGILIVFLFMPILNQLILSSLPLIQRFVFTIYSYIFLFLGLGCMYLVLRFQVFLKLMSKKALNRTCNFFIIMGTVIFLLLFSTTLHFVNTGDEAIESAFIYTSLGLIIGAYKIKDKYITE